MHACRRQDVSRVTPQCWTNKNCRSKPNSESRRNREYYTTKVSTLCGIGVPTCNSSVLIRVIMAWPGSADFSGLQQSPTSTPFGGDVPPSLQQVQQQQQQQQQLTPTSSSTAGPPRKRKKSEIQDDQSPQADASGGLAKAHPVKRACNQCRQQKVRLCTRRERVWGEMLTRRAATMQHPDRTRVPAMRPMHQAQPDVRHRSWL